MRAGGDGNKNIIPINIEDEMKRSYLDYSIVRHYRPRPARHPDALKPVHRRILYGCTNGLHSTVPRASAPRSRARCWEVPFPTATLPSTTH